MGSMGFSCTELELSVVRVLLMNLSRQILRAFSSKNKVLGNLVKKVKLKGKGRKLLPSANNLSKKIISFPVHIIWILYLIAYN